MIRGVFSFSFRSRATKREQNHCFLIAVKILQRYLQDDGERCLIYLTPNEKPTINPSISLGNAWHSSLQGYRNAGIVFVAAPKS